MGKLNYDKWAALELSDDSDIEEHPNIDKRSMINWKQRDIHEQREMRKQRIANYHAEVALNNVLIPRVVELRNRVKEAGRSAYSKEVARLKENPSDAKPPTGHAKQPTYDEMMLHMLLKIWEECKEELGKKYGGKGADEAGEEKWTEALVQGLIKHEDGLKERSEECEQLAKKEEEEQKRKITSEDVKEGWSSSHINKITPTPLDDIKPKPTAKSAQNIEVLNPGAAGGLPPLDPAKYPSNTTSATGLSGSMPPIPATSSADDNEGIPDLTPSGRAFSQIPVRGYTKSLEFIQRDPSVLAESTTDSLLGEAFEACLKGESARALQCVHQGLLIQYCRKLGRDGVRLFFDRMINGGPKAESVFQNDVKQTYERIVTRVTEIRADMEKNGAERETIQLMAEDPSTSIGFNIPDGPPPENLVVEGFESEDPEAGMPNIEDIRAFLQMKWELFDAFPQDLKDAMKSESLDAVNKVLEKMDVQQAEKVVNDMQEGGMLSFG
ncbi:hypothetical protein QFC19_003075 [Naganishia cerealis]|uniref:Uncharacterized protein n=1 Tax=Naganishia cerealis TaxID=610337 RepID=A0ACC2W562_9TREE|nr:hypothetical protein QFC19_003075 [Naganishia cerealis]